MAGFDPRVTAQQKLTKKRCEELVEVLYVNAQKGDLTACALLLELAGYIENKARDGN